MLDERNWCFKIFDTESYCFYIAQNFFQVIKMNNLLWNNDSFYKCKIIFINFIVENQKLLDFFKMLNYSEIKIFLNCDNLLFHWTF